MGVFFQKEEKLIFLKKLFTQPVRTITTTELENKMQDKSTVLLDVRTAQEYIGGHIKEARLFSLDRIHTYEGKKDKSVYLICHSGARSKRAAKILKAKGYDAISVKGGMLAWHGKIVGGK
ncbi:Rhodanese-related sulfurtransferase [Streptococcus equinus]|nr:Rhodanese-related sulfurtransferase [Streptococcus equinus]